MTSRPPLDLRTTPDDPLADDRLTLVGLLLETHAGIGAAIEADLGAHHLSGSEFEVLLRLARSPGRRLRMSELARQCTVSNSGLTRVVDRLGYARLVTRARHEDDRRGTWAVLTDRGLERVHAVLPSHLATVDRLLTAVLDPGELEALEATLRKLRAVARPSSDPDA